MNTQDELGWTIDRFILERQKRFPEASGEFTTILQAIALAGRVIASKVQKAGLADVLGATGAINVQGESVQKLDVLANRILIRCLETTGHVCAMASEESESVIPIASSRGKYVVLFDPLDGSSNIDVNISIGTIFSIYRRKSESGPGTEVDCLRRGTEQLAAGYIIYGSSTMLVYTTGEGVHGFTLDPMVGEFFLSHENIRIPPHAPTYSVNEANAPKWSSNLRRWVEALKSKETPASKPYSLRYVGTLVADFHRTLLRGGIFAYPGDQSAPKGKLRLLYEAAPLAFVAEAAGGAASDGMQRILDIEASNLHERTPLFIGSKEDVAFAERFLRQGEAHS
ncbi:MAG: class 1 fructose-bisphosphatase [Sandaracinaceae bacterium]|nr:class 1 fructose-bisphosphatase [Sandaracinaceae bacterium]MDW8247114.1 class 1 fructose-bisphosphatase [Sandaracinaceae bacterium]